MQLFYLFFMHNNLQAAALHLINGSVKERLGQNRLLWWYSLPVKKNFTTSRHLFQI